MSVKRSGVLSLAAILCLPALVDAQYPRVVVGYGPYHPHYYRPVVGFGVYAPRVYVPPPVYVGPPRTVVVVRPTPVYATPVVVQPGTVYQSVPAPPQSR